MTAPTLRATRPLTPTAPAAEPAGLGTIGLLTVLLGAFLPMLDFFIVNVALPTIDTDLRASAGTLELIVAGYGISYAVLMVLGGRLGDAFGRRRLFMIGMAAFTLTSAVCGLAPTAGLLVIGRVAQGASAALMLPQVLATIQATTSGASRARALSRYGVTAGIATVVGQLLGGVLVTANIAGTGWRPIFLVNVPVGIVGMLLAARYVPDTRSEQPAGVDTRGTALLAATLLALLVPLMEGRTLHWPLWTWLLLALFPFAAAALVAVERQVERRGEIPLVPPSLLRLPSMRRGLGLGVPFFAGFGGFMFVVAVVLQQDLHSSALSAGLALVPLAGTFMVASLASSRLIGRYGRPVLTAGLAVQAVGLLTLVATALLSWPDLNVGTLAPGMAITGFGQGLVMSPLFRIVLADVPSAQAGVGGGVLATTQQSALALGVATLGSLFLALSTSSVGPQHALVITLSVQAVAAVLIGLGSRRLPQPR